MDLLVSPTYSAEFVFCGGRRTDAKLLGMIRYHPAIPQLREGMMHDEDDDLRGNCAESIGRMGSRAYCWAPDIASAMVMDISDYNKTKMAEAIGKIRNPAVSVSLRDTFEYAREKVNRNKSTTGWETGLVTETIKALFLLDRPSAIEALNDAYVDGNPVWHFAKNAAIAAGFID